jgi:hypothetical protein
MVSILTPSGFDKNERDQGLRLLRHFVPRNDEKERASQRPEGEIPVIASGAKQSPGYPPVITSEAKQSSEQLVIASEAKQSPGYPASSLRAGRSPSLATPRHCERSEAISGIHASSLRAKRSNLQDTPLVIASEAKQSPGYPARHCERGEAISGNTARHCERSEAIQLVIASEAKQSPGYTPRHCERSEAISGIHPSSRAKRQSPGYTASSPKRYS